MGSMALSAPWTYRLHGSIGSPTVTIADVLQLEQMQRFDLMAISFQTHRMLIWMEEQYGPLLMLSGF